MVNADGSEKLKWNIREPKDFYSTVCLCHNRHPNTCNDDNNMRQILQSAFRKASTQEQGGNKMEMKKCVNFVIRGRKNKIKI